MLFHIDALPVIFPYEKIYPEQYQYMCGIKRTLDANGHAILEMPSGTGKTVSILSLIVAYQQHSPIRPKLIYCSRTTGEIEKALAELKRLMLYRANAGITEDFFAVGLSSRKNLCLHPTVSKEKKGKTVDARCRDMTSPWACEKGRQDPGSVELCSFHEELGKREPGQWLPQGVWTFEDLMRHGRETGVCPYFAARRMLPHANVIIYSFWYMVDPKIAEQVSRDLSKNSIVVMDEAHNIDDVCIESLSIDLTRPMLDASARSANLLADRITEMKKTDADKLQNEYQKLVEGLQAADEARREDSFMANPTLPDDLLKEAVPGNIRRAEHFVAFLKRFIEYLKTRMRVLHVVAETPTSFLTHVKDITFIEKKPLRFCAERLTSLVRTLELTRIDEYSALQKVAQFATLVATYEKGFLLILEPFETETATVPNPVFHLACLDASIAIKPVFDRFTSVILTSGTISPLDMYPKMLGFETVTQESYAMTLNRQSFLPMVITRGSDQVQVSSRFEVRSDPAVVRNYGHIMIEFSKVVPDGLVVFAPSYLYLESIVSAWNEMGILNEVWKYKLIFVETPDAAETSQALENYRQACRNGRGAVLLSVARGKVSEGIDFDHELGRAVIMLGVPFLYTESRLLKARLEHLREAHRIKEADWLSFDALRNAAQCLGRALRGKQDYGIMVLADKRYSRGDKLSKLPKWIAQYLVETRTNLSTDMAVVLAKQFLRTVAQPLEKNAGVGHSLWTLEDLKARQEREYEAAQRLLGPAPGRAAEAEQAPEEEEDDADADFLGVLGELDMLDLPQ